MLAVASPLRRFGRPGALALSFSALWSVGLLLAAMFAPAYQSAGGGAANLPGVSSSASASGSETLVAVNGWPVLLPVGVPLAATVLVGIALWLRGTRQWAGIAAWVITGLLACFNLLALASIGMFVVPVTAGLVVACASRSGRPKGPPNWRARRDSNPRPSDP